MQSHQVQIFYIFMLPFWLRTLTLQMVSTTFWIIHHSIGINDWERSCAAWRGRAAAAARQGCQLSRIERESYAWTLFFTISREACKISNAKSSQACKILRMKENITFFFFFFFFLLVTFLFKLKPTQNLTRGAKRTAKY